MRLPLRLMTLNLRRDVPEDGPHAWPHRRDRVGDLVRAQAPHVLGTQEGLPHMLADLDARLPAMHRVGTCRDGDGTGEHVALYYDAARLALVEGGDAWLSETPQKAASRSWGNRLPRHATWARFEDDSTGARFTVVNTHLDHESAPSRARSADYLQSGFPDAALLGDFNETVEGAVGARLLEGRKEAVSDGGGTFHGFSGAPIGGRIDWILVPSEWTVVSGRVLRDALVSDHFPVVADVLTAPRIGPTLPHPAAASTSRSRARPRS